MVAPIVVQLMVLIALPAVLVFMWRSKISVKVSKVGIFVK